MGKEVALFAFSIGNLPPAAEVAPAASSARLTVNGSAVSMSHSPK